MGLGLAVPAPLHSAPNLSLPSSPCTLIRMQPSALPTPPGSLSQLVPVPSNPHRGALSHHRPGPRPCPSALSTGTTCVFIAVKKPEKQSQLVSPDSPNDPIPRVSSEILGLLSKIPRSYQQFSDDILRFQSSILEFSKSWSPF